jgi:hypothetical protein
MSDETPDVKAEKTAPLLEPGAGPPTPEAAPAAEPISLGAAFAGVFFSPRQTFERLVERPWWTAFIPMAVLAVVASAVMGLFFSRVDREQFMRDQIRQNPFASQMSEAQVDQAVEDAAKRPMWIQPVMVFFGSFIFYVILAAIFWLVFLAMGHKITFGRSLIATAWAFVPTLLGSLVFVALVFIKNPNDIDLQNPLMTNVAAFFDRETLAKPLYAVLKSLDVFNAWVIALLGFGMAAAGRCKVLGAVTVIVILYILVTLVKVGFAAIF